MEEDLLKEYKAFLLEFVRDFRFTSGDSVEDKYARICEFETFAEQYDSASTIEANRLAHKVVEPNRKQFVNQLKEARLKIILENSPKEFIGIILKNTRPES